MKLLAAFFAFLFSANLDAGDACFSMDRGLTIIPPGYLPQPAVPVCILNENNVTMCRTDPRYGPKRVHFNPRTGEQYNSNPGLEASKNWKVWPADKQPQELYLEEIAARRKAEEDLIRMTDLELQRRRDQGPVDQVNRGGTLWNDRAPNFDVVDHQTIDDRRATPVYYEDDVDSSRLANIDRRVSWDNRAAANSRWMLLSAKNQHTAADVIEDRDAGQSSVNSFEASNSNYNNKQPATLIPPRTTAIWRILPRKNEQRLIKAPN